MDREPSNFAPQTMPTKLDRQIRYLEGAIYERDMNYLGLRTSADQEAIQNSKLGILAAQFRINKLTKELNDDLKREQAAAFRRIMQEIEQRRNQSLERIRSRESARNSRRPFLETIGFGIQSIVTRLSLFFRA